MTEIIGDWVRLPDGRIGQVWALGTTTASVWVADGREFTAARIDDLKPATHEEPDLFAGEPA